MTKKEKFKLKKQIEYIWFHLLGLVVSIALALFGFWLLNIANSHRESTHRHRIISRGLLQSATGVAISSHKLTSYLHTKNQEDFDNAYISVLSSWGVITPFIGRDDLPKLEFNIIDLQTGFNRVIAKFEIILEKDTPSLKDIVDLQEELNLIVIKLGHDESKQWTQRGLTTLETRKKNDMLFIALSSIITFLFATLLMLYIFAYRKQKIQRLLNQQKKDIAVNSKMAAIGEFSATIIHEINNPLTVILWRLKMVRTYLEELISGDPKLRKNFNSLEDQTQRIDKIIKGVKLLSKNTETEELDTFDIMLLKDQLEDLIEAKSKYSQFDFKFNVIGSNRKIKAKQVQLSQVLTNLVNNSMDAIKDNNEKWIRVDIIFEPNSLDIDITDSGTGLSENDQDNLFKLFYSTKSAVNGTGIGLNLSARIIAEHGGTLSYNPYVPNTQFQISIPQ